jgi:hypothetical protein
MSEDEAQQALIKSCPCGRTPDNLIIEVAERAKYGLAMGDCCGTWSIEFRNGYQKDRLVTEQLATEAWNSAPRAG